MKSMLKSLMSVAAAALALTSCSTDATDEVIAKGELKTLKVNATIEQTRTTLADDHVNLAWSDGDKILLYIGNKLAQADAIEHTIGANDITAKYSEGDVVHANYSLDNAKYSKGAAQAEINIEEEQTQSAANFFAGENLPMVAKGAINGDKVNLTFKPVGCVLVFNVYGPAANEKIKSIKFETSTRCCGYELCDLTADALNYTAKTYGQNYAKVTLTESATIGTSKPTDTKLGSGNQVYLVVLQKEYPAGSKFIVTTDAGEYTFTTTTAFDCSAKTARVVNLNLAKSAELKQEIIVPTVDEQSSDSNANLLIEGIQFKNLSAEQIGNARISIYNDTALDLPMGEAFWLKIGNRAELSNGKLYCDLAANPDTAPRTAYIVIECGDVKSSAIAITQVGAGEIPTVTAVVTYVPENMKYTSGDAVKDLTLEGSPVHLAFAKASGTSNPPKYYSTEDSALRCYAKNTITVSGAKILKIVITRGAKDKNNRTWSANVGTMSGDSWTGENNEVVLTVGGTDGQIRVESMEITYVEGSGENPDPVQPDPDPTTPPAPGTILLNEDFDSLTGTAEWTNYAPKFSAGIKVYEENGSIRLGANAGPGSITTQELNLLAPTTLEFKVKGWTDVEGSINILVDGKKVQNITYIAKKADEFEQKSVQLEAATGTSTITIATTAKRAIIDDIVVKVTE